MDLMCRWYFVVADGDEPLRKALQLDCLIMKLEVEIVNKVHKEEHRHRQEFCALCGNGAVCCGTDSLRSGCTIFMCAFVCVCVRVSGMFVSLCLYGGKDLI